jgi:hypothetical protein
MEEEDICSLGRFLYWPGEYDRDMGGWISVDIHYDLAIGRAFCI